MSQNPNILKETRKRPAENDADEESTTSKIANRDFLAEFRKVQSEADEVRNALISKTGHFQNLLSESGTLKDIMMELKGIRKEIKEGKEENDKKFEDLKTELKTELFEQNLKFQQKMEETEKKTEEKLLELKNEILNLSENVDKAKENPVVPETNAEAAPKIPIRQAVLGEWEMVDYMSSENDKIYGLRFEKFSKNLKFELVDGKLKQSGADMRVVIEGGGDFRFGRKYLYVEEDHLKTFWSEENIADFYIHNGQLNFTRHYFDDVSLRIYKKI